MPYVERKAGMVVGRYANAQPGYAEEWIDEGHPDLSVESPEEIARKAELVAIKQIRDDTKADAMFKALEKADSTQIANWIDTNFSGMTAQQRALLKLLTQVAVMTLQERG